MMGNNEGRGVEGWRVGWAAGATTACIFQRLSEGSIEDLLLEYGLDASGAYQDKRARLLSMLGLQGGPPYLAPHRRSAQC